MVERVTRIELALSAWEADVLPLNYTRAPGNAKDHTWFARRFARGVCRAVFHKAVPKGWAERPNSGRLERVAGGNIWTQREDAVPAGTGQDGCGATEKKG